MEKGGAPGLAGFETWESIPAGPRDVAFSPGRASVAQVSRNGRRGNAELAREGPEENLAEGEGFS